MVEIIDLGSRKHETLVLNTEQKKVGDLLLCLSGGEWVMKIKSYGIIEFNHEAFPDMKAHEFAFEVIQILEAIRLRSYKETND